MMSSFLIGGLAVTLLMLGWAVVQSAWRRTFPEATADPDVLAHRLGCQGCTGARCHQRCQGEATRAKEMS